MKYLVTGLVTISMYTIVEAIDEEEAMEKSRDRLPGGLTIAAFSDQPEDAWITDEIDGEVEPTSASLY